MGKLDLAMDIFIEMFQKYATKDGDRLHLSGRELRNMFRTELCELLQGIRDTQKVGEILTGLDQNLDGQVDFEEFVSMVVKLTMCSNAYFDTIYGQSFCGVK